MVSKSPEAETVLLIINGATSAPIEHGVDALTKALRKKGMRVVRQAAVGKGKALRLVIGLAGSSPWVDRTLRENALRVPKDAESLCIQKLRRRSPPKILIAGRDARGLMYALLEVARAIELAPPGTDPFEAVEDATESPGLAVRSVNMSLYNADLEREWYFDEGFWRAYFAMLARDRYNQFSLIFAHHTSYLCPPYPFLVRVPDFPNVKAKGLSAQDRERNLAMLRTIGELARDHGIDFNFAVWTQRPMYGKNMVSGWPADRAADYCARALKRVLRACPAIRGVQFRMNIESGIEESRQAEYYAPQFRAIRECGRPVRLDLRFKGLRPDTIRTAVAMGLAVTVSTKYWCEHMGLPYHPTEEDKHYSHGRYGYADMLAYPRPYRVVYRLWTVGSQRLLLWGDPEHAARFARSCRLGGGEGFEVFAPLTNKGYGNAPGKWRIFADKSYEHYRWEYERYWMFYLVFGRLGYNAEAGPRVWRREFRHRFGKAASAVEAAYRAAGQILPFLTAARLKSASEWRTWPEVDPGYPLGAYARIVPSDTAQFYPIRTFARVPGYRSESWDGRTRGYVEDAVRGHVRAKWTPFAVSRRLRALSQKTLAAIDRARRLVADPRAAQFKGTELDMRILAHIALYHAEKILAATHVELFTATKEAGRLPVALEHIRAAAAAWERIVELTEGVYHADLVFGMQAPESLEPPFDKTTKIAHHLAGHWKDRLEMARCDLAHVEDLVKKHGGHGKSFRRMPGEAPLAGAPVVGHKPIRSAGPGVDLKIAARITSPVPLRRVVLHYRPVNQTLDWREMEMRKSGQGRFAATIRGRYIIPRWDFMYYIEALVEGGGGTLWPSWEDGPPYVVVTLKRHRPPRKPGPRRPLATVQGDRPTIIEAEDGSPTALWAAWELEKNAKGYSGKGYLCALPDAGSRVGPMQAETAATIEFPLQFKQPGAYRVWVRMAGPDRSGNSIYLGLDGAPLPAGDYLHAEAAAGWLWVGKTFAGQPVLINVPKAGLHTLNIWMREDGVSVDKILVTRDPKFVPR